MSSRVVVWQHSPGEPPGTVSDYLAAAGLQGEVWHLYRHLPSRVDWDQIAGVVVLGGPMNVDETDKYPFLLAEREWLREAVRREVPVLGICLGAQLLARSLGGRVYPNHVKEIGWYPVTFTPAAETDALFCGVPWQGWVFQYHGDTFTLPEGATLLATAPQCTHQAFRFGTSAWGLQFHLEVTPQIIEAWTAAAEKLGELRQIHRTREEILADLPQQLARMQPLTAAAFSRFAQLCADRVLCR